MCKSMKLDSPLKKFPIVNAQKCVIKYSKSMGKHRKAQWDTLKHFIKKKKKT